jgi:hypothetical protein
MTTATMWADTSNAMWIGIGFLGIGVILAGVVLYLIVKPGKGADDG